MSFFISLIFLMIISNFYYQLFLWFAIPIFFICLYIEAKEDEDCEKWGF